MKIVNFIPRGDINLSKFMSYILSYGSKEYTNLVYPEREKKLISLFIYILNIY